MIWAMPIVYIGGRQSEWQVLSAVIHHGRDDPGSQPLASTCTLELVKPLPPEAVMGASVELVARMLGGAEYTRFIGEITDFSIGFDSVDVPRPQTIGTGKLGRIGRRVVGSAPWPAELEGDRVNRILTLAGFTPNPLSTDPGTVVVLPRDVDRQAALDLAHEYAEDGGGMLWQSANGEVQYADALHRRGVVVGFEFKASDIGLDINWLQGYEGLINDVWLSYGPTPEGGEQAQVHASDPASIAERGTYGASISTNIESAGDAQKRADTIIARQSTPPWVIGGLEVNLSLLDEPRTNELFVLDVHSLISVTGLPEGSPATSAMLWVEGWRETIQQNSWIIQYATSDYCRSGAPPLWDDLPTTLTWDTIDPVRTWNSAVCIPPEPSRGRWDDQAASLRWDQINSAYTWDTYPN